MKQILSVLCEDAIEDAENHLNTLIRIYSELVVKKFPSVIPKLCFYAILDKSPLEDRTFKGEITVKQGGIKSQSFHIDFDFGNNNKLNIIFRLSMLEIVRKGDLEISLLKDNETLARASIIIKYDIPLISKGFIDPRIM